MGNRRVRRQEPREAKRVRPPLARLAASPRARRLYAAERSAQERDAVKYMDQAERTSARGKPQVAHVLYQMAERRASGELKSKIRQRMAALKPVATASASAKH